MEDSIKSIFVKEKPVKLLEKLKSPNTENYASNLSTAIDTTSAHTISILNKLKAQGIVTSEKKGRKKILELTEEGEELAEAALKFNAALENSELGSV